MMAGEHDDASALQDRGCPAVGVEPVAAGRGVLGGKRPGGGGDGEAETARAETGKGGAARERGVLFVNAQKNLA